MILCLIHTYIIKHNYLSISNNFCLWSTFKFLLRNTKNSEYILDYLHKTCVNWNSSSLLKFKSKLCLMIMCMCRQWIIIFIYVTFEHQLLLKVTYSVIEILWGILMDVSTCKSLVQTPLVRVTNRGHSLHRCVSGEHSTGGYVYPT